MSVYFLRPVGMLGPIKIGCSKQVHFRMDALATWSPFPLELIVEIEGRICLERNIHECFADLHSHKEWFHPGRELLLFIEKLKAGIAVQDAIDLTKRIRPIVAMGGKRPAKAGMEGYRSYQTRLRWADVKASKIVGQPVRVPADVDDIMRRWAYLLNTHPKHLGRRPSDEEFARLDQVLADPAKHCLTHAQRFPKPKAVEVAA